jgi:enoyl-CoA hydratase
VGGGWYLSRLPGRLGPYLALTGARLDGGECLWAGLATHYLEDGRGQGAADRGAGLATIATRAGTHRGHAEAIARLFASDRLEDILAALAAMAAILPRNPATIPPKAPHLQGFAAPTGHQPAPARLCREHGDGISHRRAC